VLAEILRAPPLATLPTLIGLELARSLAWLAVVGFVLFFAYAKRFERSVAIGGLAAASIAVIYVFAVSLGAAFGIEPLAGMLRMTFIARLVIAVLGLAMVENLFRNSGAEARWAVKYLCFALGVIFAYDFFIYADAALTDRVDPRFYAARGIIDAMAAPLVVIAAVRSRNWPIDIYISRQVVFHSATLLATGAYLVVMSMIGTWLKVFDSAWGSVAQVSFISAAVVLLAIVLSSGRIQAALRNFISRNFFSYKYDYRKEWLRFLGSISDSLTELTVPERVIRALANMMDSTAAAVWVRRDEDNAFQAAGSWNMSDILPSIEDADPFVAATLPRGGIIDIPGVSVDGAGANDLNLPAWLTAHPRARLIVPLVHGGVLLGFVVLGDLRAERKLDWEDFELLKTAGRQAASYIAEANAARSLAQARRFEDFNRQFAFVAHDIKNLAGQMTLILKNAERHGDNPEFQKDMLKTIGHSVTRMRTMLSQLRAGAAQQAKNAPVDVNALLRRHAESWKMQIPNLQVDLPGQPVTVVGDEERLDAVCNHLLQNASDAAGEGGRVAVELHIEGVARSAGPGAANSTGTPETESWGVITISDDGPGMDPAFVDQKLFQPLTSAKPSGFGIGAFQARSLIREMHGRLDVDTKPGSGTRMIVRLPLARALMAAETPESPKTAPAPAENGRELLVSYG
ncbi:MAG: XrtA/PEP-CTERM system histidine kinase PrsK, partial [Rhodospirillaceae bacterium]